MLVFRDNYWSIVTVHTTHYQCQSRPHFSQLFTLTSLLRNIHIQKLNEGLGLILLMRCLIEYMNISINLFDDKKFIGDTQNSLWIAPTKRLTLFCLQCTDYLQTAHSDQFKTCSILYFSAFPGGPPTIFKVIFSRSRWEAGKFYIHLASSISHKMGISRPARHRQI